MDPTSKPLPSLRTMQSAYLKRRKKYDDVFFVGVKSTGIFNRVTCPVRKPAKKNMVFFSSVKEALDYGYRPCKICRPMVVPGETPREIGALLSEIDSNPYLRVRDVQLHERGIHPAKLRRWFKKHFGITFRDYLKYSRINHRFGNILHSERIKIHKAYHVRPPAKIAAEPDGEYAEEEKPAIPVAVTRIHTPIGPLLAGATDEGICLLEFTDRRKLETQIRILGKRMNAEFYPGKNPWFDVLARQLRQYFSGERKDFDIPLVTPGTPFQQKVWESIKRVPYGKITTYKRQSLELGNPKAVRAIGHANGDNRIAILIPCHRVLGNNGELVGYGGGLWRKKFLLELEDPSQTKLFENEVSGRP